jgi:hypothetical protein
MAYLPTRSCNRYNNPRFSVNVSGKLLIMKVSPRARMGLCRWLGFAVLFFMVSVAAGSVQAQSKPAARTITVYQDPG